MSFKINSRRLKKSDYLNSVDSGLIEIERFKKTRATTYFLKNFNNCIDFSQFFKISLPLLASKLRLLCTHSSYKFNLFVECVYENILNDEQQNVAFKSSNIIVNSLSNYKYLLNKMFQKLLFEESDFVGKGSNWSLKQIDGIQLRTNKVNLVGGGTYIKLPKVIEDKKAIINIRNKDNKCFKYAILTKYNKWKNKNIMNENNFNFLEKTSGLNFNCIDFPTPINHVKKFERINNVSINIFSKDDQNIIYPLYICKKEKNNHFDLFVFGNYKKLHYCYINNFSRLIRSQITKHDRKLIICKQCFTTFSNKPIKTRPWGYDGLENHRKICRKHKLCNPVMLDKQDDKFIEFKHFTRSDRMCSRHMNMCL